MPTSLISDSQKNTISAIIDDIHETFARSITVYEEGKKVLISVNRQLKINGFTGDNAHLNGTYTQVSTNSYTQENGSGDITRVEEGVGTESDPNLVQYRWEITDGSDNDPGTGDAASNYISKQSTDPSVSQPYEMTWSSLTLTEFVIGDTFNGVYGRSVFGNKTTTTTAVQHTIKARIKYIDAKEANLTDGNIGSQLDIELVDGSVRITVDAAGFNLLKEAKRCEFEGGKYEIVSKGNPTGIFGPQYYHFYLKPIEELQDASVS